MLRFKFWSNWVLLPRSMRFAATASVLVAFASGALLYQTNIRADRPPAFGRGGAFAGNLVDPGTTPDLSIPSPAASRRSVARTKSSAVITAPTTPDPNSGFTPKGARFPSLGRYVYAVQGYEEATAFGRRSYPSEMTTTVHRTQPTESSVPKLEPDEIIFDLYFSDDHEEREILAYRDGGIVFTYEAGSVSFGFTQTSEATYDPPMLQIPAPLEVGTKRTGTSEAKSPSGEVTRTEDWTVEILGVEQLDILGERIDTWVVQINRQSRPGGSEEVTRSRKYWFDPNSAIWVKWEEKLDGSQDFGPGSFNYSTEFTATLSRIEPV